MLTWNIREAHSARLVARWQQALIGVGLALVAVVYGLLSLQRGETIYPSRDGLYVFHGAAAMWLAIAYMALGAFIHFHCFWGLMVDRHRISLWGRWISAVLFFGFVGYALYLYA